MDTVQHCTARDNMAQQGSTLSGMARHACCAPDIHQSCDERYLCWSSVTVSSELMLPVTTACRREDRQADQKRREGKDAGHVCGWREGSQQQSTICEDVWRRWRPGCYASVRSHHTHSGRRQNSHAILTAHGLDESLMSLTALDLHSR